MLGLSAAALATFWVAAGLLGAVPQSAGRSEIPPTPPAPTEQYVVFQRRGLFARVGAGLTLCAQDICDSIPVGGLGRAELGYRVGLFSLVATASGGGGRLDVPDFEDDDAPVTNIRGGLTMLYVGGGVLVHPLSFGRVDPFVGVTFGYSRVQERLISDQREVVSTFSRGGVELGGGIDVFVGRRVSLGPRFDAVVPFGGSLCTQRDGLQNCNNVIDLVSSDTAAVERRRRRNFPRPWSVAINATFYLQ